MSDLTLGLDLGSQSIGWAIVDESGGQLVAAGVRVFPEGVDRDKQGGEKSKNEARRIARGMRRQIARRARRKRRLRDLLRKANLLPNSPADESTVDLLDPYELRSRALHERLEPFEVGRVLVHLNQRRGFLSNRKTDRARKKENSVMLEEISELAVKIGDQTLGQHLAAMNADRPLARLRGRHTRRDMYVNEFNQIWDEQRKHHPTLLTDELKQELYDPSHDDDWVHKGLIFGQHRIYWPKSVVGACELEPKKKRCPRADRSAQRFRLLQEVNNLRLLDSNTGVERALSPDERAKLLKYLERFKERTFDQIRKHLGLYEHVRFNFERADRKKLHGMPTDAALAHKDRFGKGWYDRSGDQRNTIVRLLIGDDEDAVRRAAAAEEWELSEEGVEALLDTDFEDGYSSYCLDAIDKLLPHLERGLPLMSRDDTPCALREAGYLRPDQRTVGQRDFLPKPPDVTNPLVRQALHEVRKVVNAIIREYGKPARIHIEMAREVKGTLEQRSRMNKENRERQAERDDAADRIRKHGVKVSRDAIDRYRLWKEQDEACIYSGRSISLVQLLGGEVDIDHILPRHRSLDNSLMNRVVCFRDENRDKSDRTPYEWLAESNPAKYEAILQRARDLPYPKLRRFRQQDVTLDDFVARQLNDTAYITTQVHKYVECLGSDIVCTKGQLVHDLRRHWELDGVLRNDDLDIKNRDDHRHHAVDAIVIALMNRSRLQQLSRLYSRDGMPSDALPLPWKSFRADIEQAVNAINVSHRVRRRIRGALHEETIYGPTQKPNRAPSSDRPRPWAKNWTEDAGRFVYRKPLTGLTLAMIDDIRDETIRAIVAARLDEFGFKPGEKGKIPAEVWKQPLLMPSGVPIKKVRLLKSDKTIQPIRGGAALVKPGSTHHLCIFEFNDEREKTRRDAEFVTMIEAARRIRDLEPLFRRQHTEHPDAKFVMSLSPGDIVLANVRGSDQLMVFRTGASTQGQLYFANHTDARRDKDIKKFVATANSLKGRRVIVDVLGRVRNTND